MAEEISIALTSETVKILAIAIVSLKHLDDVGGVVGVLGDQVQDLLDVPL